MLDQNSLAQCWKLDVALALSVIITLHHKGPKINECKRHAQLLIANVKPNLTRTTTRSVNFTREG
jgi:hypothetical protein